MSSFSLIFIVLMVFVFFLIGACFHQSRKSEETLKFYSERKIILISIFICFFVVSIFLFFRENSFKIPEGIGQVGDFIGGLTNPILSFAALIVLLRSTTIQTHVIKVQQETQALDSFLNEFYRLQNNIYTISDKMDIDGHARILYRCFRSKRKELSKQNLNHASYEDQARKYVLEAIEHISFERFALSVRMAMHHIEASNPKEAYRYGLIIRDTMTIAERIVFLTWIFYYWPTAKKWFVSYKDKDGNKHPYDYTRGLNPEDFISDDVYNYFYQEPPKKK